MTWQTWTMTSQLVAQRTSDLRRLATPRRRTGGAAVRKVPGTVALVTGRALVAAGVRLGGNCALPAALRRRIA